MRAAVPIAVLVVVAIASPAAAADEQFVSLESRDGGFTYEVVVLEGDGSGKRRPIDGQVIGRPALAPNGNRIVYAAPLSDGTDGRWGIFRSKIDGTGRKRLTAPPIADGDPAWSSDGRWIAYSRVTKGSLRADTCCIIRVMRTTGKNQAKVPGTRGGINPSWSPSGNRIVYEKNGGLWVTNLNGRNTYQLAVNGREPAWSPDGDKVAYVRSVGGGHELVVIPAGGGAPKVRAAGSRSLESPVWDEDGSTLYFVRYAGTGYDGRSGTAVWWDRAGTPAERLFTQKRALVHLAHSGGRQVDCDLDGDLIGDLAVGAPDDDEAGQRDSGVVNVFMGRTGGLGTGDDDLWHQGRPIGGSPGPDDGFGAALACGDFDGDGRDDLAVGAPTDFLGRGVVNVIYGSGSGLIAVGSQLLHQDVDGVDGAAESGDRFGASLAAGDFDGDGRDDLAIGAPGDGAGGAVNILYGSASGLTAAGSQLWSQATSGIKGDAEAGDGFGSSLAVGDFDGNGRDDLAVGVPGENRNRGAAAVIYGKASGLTAAGDQLWRQGSAGIQGDAERGDVFGKAVAAGDLDGDGRDDLAVGAPGENDDRGAVAVLYGSKSKLSAAGDDSWMQGSGGVRGSAERNDRFGDALAIGDFDHDGHGDLAIGVPGENQRRGAVAVLYGTVTGVDASRDDLWRQGSHGVKGKGQKGDLFGKSLSAGDFDGDRRGDLAIGVPREDHAGSPNEGAVNVLYGSAGGLSAEGDDLWRQDGSGVAGTGAAGDKLGILR